jgi:lipoprotein-releasing system ATP-binding protein
MTDTGSVVRCSGLERSFVLDRKASRRLEILKGIDFSVAAGEVVTIVGASGSGKSTLLHLLGGLDRPSAGAVYWEEKDLARLDDDALALLRGGHVGFVFQFHHLLPEFTALENVLIPQMIQGKGGSAARERAEGLLARVGLSGRLHHLPSELSGGEQQRVAVARALANAPKVIFADEPTGNLDSTSSGELQELFAELNAGAGQTFVIVTHNEEFARHSNRVFRMQDGQLLQTS